MRIINNQDKIIMVYMKFGKIYGCYYPHFIVQYGCVKAKFAIDLTIFEGGLPPKITNFILDWAKKNSLELEAEWKKLIIGTKKLRQLQKY